MENENSLKIVMKPKIHCTIRFLKKCVLIVLIYFVIMEIIRNFVGEKWVAEKIFCNSSRKTSRNYLVASQKCRMIDMDPWNTSVIENPIDSYDCSQGMVKFSSVEKRKNVGNVLVIDEDAVERYEILQNTTVECCFSIITRGSKESKNDTTKSDDIDFTYSKSGCHQIQREEVLSNTTEFVYVECNTPSSSEESVYEIYSHVHAIVPILPDVAQRLKSNKPKNESENWNVLLIGIDSMSRLALQRLMPYTANYFRQKKWIELKGYNKIADNTHPNLLAVLTGRNGSDTSERCKEFNSTHKKCNLIWDEFKSKGYATAYAEDTPGMSTFNLDGKGFYKKPTDYYLRPLFLAADDLVKVTTDQSLSVCYGVESSINYVLNYANDFAETFKDHNFFGLFWMNSYSHNDNNMARAMDSTFEKFLRNLKHTHVYENTFVVAFSDHGLRFGYPRKTFLGYYEERLPFINILVPRSFREKYPEKYENLIWNQNQLTSPYDLYLTLQEIQNETVKAAGCSECVSLFKKVPLDRNCKSAGIDPEWCMCSTFESLNLTDPFVTQLGRFLLNHINDKTKYLLVKNNLNESLCEHREFTRVTEGYQSFPTEKSEKAYYIITIEASPFKATFQAKIEVYKDEMTVLNFISRLDSYGGSSCHHVPDLFLLCYCSE